MSTRALILVLVAALVAASCGGSDSATGAAADDETTAATADESVDSNDVDSGDSEGDPDDGSDADDTHTHDDGDHDHDEDDDDAASTDGSAGGVGLDTSLFLDGAIVGEPTIEACTLSDGSTSECYTVTVVGTPVNHDVGPFCPTSITDGEEAGGLWLDGENSYVIDGEFFTELAEIYGDELWNNIVNEDGSINVIDNAEDFQVAARPDITEEFYYHCVDGDVTWTNDGEQIDHTIQMPVTPVLADGVSVQFATGAHSNLGITLNGALLSGSADMTAILASYTIAAFDDCGGHINPALGYHVHGTSGCADVGDAPEGETPPFAYAIDGFTIHAPYEDGVDVELDECNGHTSEEYGYHYHAAPLEENATLTCLMGLTVEGAGAGAGRPEGGPPGGGRPDDG